MVRPVNWKPCRKSEGEPRAAALVCHPHPLFGGTLHNKVVYRTARALRNSGHVVLRFNFRGVGNSQGEHAHGVGEIEDARAALDWLRARYPDLPYLLAGFLRIARDLEPGLRPARRRATDRTGLSGQARVGGFCGKLYRAQGFHPKHTR